MTSYRRRKSHGAPGSGSGQPIRRDLRREEEWARSMISQALAVPVEQHDDDSSPVGMHDLNILHHDRPAAAVEVTAAADAAFIELWNLMNGDHRRWQEEGMQGGWMVVLDQSARANRLRRELPRLLKQMEVREIRPGRLHRCPLDAFA